MANFISQPNSSLSIAEIHAKNPSFTPTKNTLLLVSTIGGNAASIKLDKISTVQFFDESLLKSYCSESESNLYSESLKFRN